MIKLEKKNDGQKIIFDTIDTNFFSFYNSVSLILLAT